MRILIGQSKVKGKDTRTIQYPVERTEGVGKNSEKSKSFFYAHTIVAVDINP
jgi:hypothetical protein